MGYNHILLVDDNESIHEDIESILSPSFCNDGEELKDIEDELFGGSPNDQAEAVEQTKYDIDHAYQGEEAVEMVAKAAESGIPYALVFMDVRMPPGMDGIQTIKEIWKKYPYTEIVICTAYSDYSWNEIIQNLGNTDKLLFIKKPFDATALKQMAQTLTTKWQLQQEAISYTEKLEKEVDERTQQLNELVEKYKKMKDKAEEATATKSIFLANMSHEIRTPMNAVMGMNGLLLETELNSKQRKLSEMVRTSAKSLLRVINDVLDFSKIEAGKLEIENIPLNLRKVVEEVVQVISFSAKDKGLDINHTVDEHIPQQLYGDPLRIRQILLNYGSNAVKFTEKGSVSFDVRLVESDDKKQSLKCSVIDTGVGIPEKKQAEIFGSYSQADSSTSRKHGGSGLGLTICRQLADLMDGEVGLHSEIDKGSTFYVIIPLKEVADDEKYAADDNHNESENTETRAHRFKHA
jgi:signal transduction histidine kinase